jgi:cbb3-type cytochrome oxidase maturation protein
VTILYLLIPVSLLFVVAGIGVFIWAVKSGQYEDMEGPAHRILMDDDDPRIPSARKPSESNSEEGSDDASAK